MKNVRKLFAIALALILLFSISFAESNAEETDDTTGIALGSFVLPDGAACVTLPESAGEAPEGLEAMYHLMSECDNNSECYLIRAENGYALLSIASTPITITVGDIDASSSLVEERLQQEGAVNVSHSPAVFCGLDCVAFSASILCENLQCTAQGMLIPLSDALLETWMIYPNTEQSSFSEGTIQKIEYDIAQMNAVWDSIEFVSESLCRPFNTLNTPANYETAVFDDPEGYYSLTLPAETVTLLKGAENTEIQACRESFTSFFPEGAGVLFDDALSCIDTDNYYLLPQGALLDIMCSESAAEFTPEEISQVNAEYVLNLLKETYNAAFLINQYQLLTCNGLPFEMDTFFIRSGECSFVLDVLCYCQGGYCYEMDLYVPASSLTGSSDYRLSLLHLFETAAIFPLSNAQ